MRGILCSPQGEPVPVSKIMMYSRAVESDAKDARGMGRESSPFPRSLASYLRLDCFISPRPYYLIA